MSRKSWRADKTPSVANIEPLIEAFEAVRFPVSDI